MTFHTRRCEVCEDLFTFRTTRKDLRDLWRCVECRKPKAVEQMNPVGPPGVHILNWRHRTALK